MSRKFNRQITQLNKEMVAIYQEDDAYMSYTSAALPRRSEVILLINEVRELFYPRHFGRRELFDCTLQYYIGEIGRAHV